MCGIVGFVGDRPSRELLLRGLEKLEYRGYDSAGISVQDTDGRIESTRAVGNLARLRAAVPVAAGFDDDGGPSGIGHTRWATHGRVTEGNAHPHTDVSERFHVVLNGIVENYLALRERLAAEGAWFTSETDAEVVAHLVAHHYDGDLVDAVRRTTDDLEGHFAFTALAADEPGLLVATRRECPLVVGIADDGHFVASAVAAFVDQTNVVLDVNDHELVVATADEVTLLDANGIAIERAAVELDWDGEAAEKGGFDSFMLKEIHEQPHAVAQTLAGRVSHAGVELDLGMSDDELRSLNRLRIVACGTSYHAGLVGRYLIEEWARLPVEIDVASEYRYRNPVVGPGDMLLGITQSGETADTLAAMRLARGRGARVLALTNVMDSQATRDSDGTIFTRAGIEIGVAATKTFTSQVTALAVLALELAQARGELPVERVLEVSRQLAELPAMIEALVAGTNQQTAALAARLKDEGFFMFLGRHVGLPVALEAALKLKEVSYIPSDAYAAGEMKHGPIAMLAENTPVICVATESPVLDKFLSNIAEVRARGAQVVAIATEGDARVAEYADDVVYVPRTDWLLQPLLAIVPLQLLAYHIACAHELNVDQPRNLAKTVTVE